jgi:hypothetical protein
MLPSRFGRGTVFVMLVKPVSPDKKIKGCPFESNL